MQQPGGINITLLGGCRQQFDPSLYIPLDLFSEQQHLPKLILCVLVFLRRRFLEPMECRFHILRNAVLTKIELCQQILRLTVFLKR